MKIFLLIILSSVALYNASAQSFIPVTELIRLCNRPFSDITDSLTERGWKYGGYDSSKNTKYAECIVWTYKFDRIKNKAQNYLYTFKNRKTDTVHSIHQFISAAYYEELTKLLPKLNYPAQKTTHDAAHGLSRVFHRPGTFIELLNFIGHAESGINEPFYELSVVKVFEWENRTMKD